MKRTLDELFPIMEVRAGCIISTHGDLTVGLELHKPEIFCGGEDAMTKMADA